VSADGTRLLVTAGAPQGVQEFSLPGLTPVRAYGPDDRARATAFSPDGTRVAAATTYADMFRLYDSATGNMLWRRLATTGRDAYGWINASHEVAGDGLVTFSADGKQLFALVADVYGRDISVFRTVLAPARTGVSVTISAAAYDQAHTAAAKVTGTTSGSVRFTYINRDGYRKSLGTVAISGGKATKTFRSTYNGKIEAVYVGDSAHLPAVATKAYRPVARMKYTTLGTYRTVDGVVIYRSYEKFIAKVAVGPAVPGRRVSVTLWRRAGGAWQSQGSIKVDLNQYGGVFLYFTKAPKAGKYRFSAAFAGDSRNAPSSVTGPAFRID
jgi:hypothetical protein